LGRLDESSGRLAEATHAYKRLMTAAADDERRALAAWSVARVYEARKLYVSARDVYLDLAARHPRGRLEPGGAPGAERVRDRLARGRWAPPARRSSPADRAADGPPLALGGPVRPGGAGLEHRRDRAVAGGQPDRAGRSRPPADARRGRRLAALVGRAGIAGRMGRLPRG